MSRDPDAAWISTILSRLERPDAVLIGELMEYMARLRAQAEPPAGGSPPSPRPRVSRPTPEDRDVFRRALFERLRDAWRRLERLPPCVSQARILRETAHLGPHYLSRDPLAPDHPPFTLASARDYGERALAIAEGFGDLPEVGDALSVLAHLGKVDADYDYALERVRRGLDVACRTGDLFIQSRLHAIRNEILSVLEADPEERITCARAHVEVAVRLGNLHEAISRRYYLAQLLIGAGRTESVGAEAEAIDVLLEALRGDPEYRRLGTYERMAGLLRAHLHQARGDLEAATRELVAAIEAHVTSETLREDYLWADLAWLEWCCLAAGQGSAFRGVCDRLRRRQRFDLRQWYLVESAPPSVRSASPVPFDEGMPPDWEWVDPLGRSSFTADRSGLRIHPVPGVGIYVNVHIPRAVTRVTGDFSITALLDPFAVMTGAGGLLVYGTDHLLLRLGVGIQFDGEITLTGKTPERGVVGLSRGLARQPHVYVRLDRSGDRFEGWCGDGVTWYRCGEASIRMDATVQVGIFAECTYRMFSLRRSAAEPFGVSEVSVAARGM